MNRFHVFLGLLVCQAGVAHAQFTSRTNPIADQARNTPRVLPTAHAQFSGPAPGGSAVTAGGSDDCATPTVIFGQGTFAFDTTAATAGAQGQLESLCDFSSTTNIDKDVWFEWTANAAGVAIIRTCGLAGHDTKIAAYSGSGCPIDGTALECNDDWCGLQSRISLEVTSGATYTLQVGSTPGAPGGSGSLEISIFAHAEPYAHDS
jgi:hypothetical protein